MKIVNSIYLLIFIFILAGCTDDFVKMQPGGEFEEGPLVEASLSLSVNGFTVSTGTRAEDETVTDLDLIASEAENRIDDIWVFQYDATTGEQIINPSYYEISDQLELTNLKVLLKEGVDSHICVVANTNDYKWVKGDGFKTYSGLKTQVLSNPVSLLLSDITNIDESKRKSIPMEGKSDKVIVEENTKIVVPVSKMYAKLKISFAKLPENMTPYSIEINSIPNYCRVESLGENLDEKQGAEYSDDEDFWTLKSINTSGEENEYIIYVPENIQGESLNEEEGRKGDDVPSKAMVFNIIMSYGSEKLEYQVYPGGDNIKNFNIKRNIVYRISIKINSASQDKHTPSANSFVVVPGNELSFEPYYRTETGGGYNFTDYLDPEDANQTIVDEDGIEKTITGDKVIAGLKIIWQTENAIGDNSKGDLIRFEKNEKFPLHSKIYVKSKNEGNALIGAYNAKGNIIWSWHIWITDNKPENVGSAVEYTTYRWDSSKIYSRAQGLIDYNDEGYYKRIPGYAIMNCNLGAMANTPYPDKFATYGLLYQWGRKDPFPQMKKEIAAAGFYNYDHNAARIYVYDNEHKLIKMSTDGYANKEDELFKTTLTTDVETLVEADTPQQKGIRFSINNPTVFISAATKLSGASFNNISLYCNEGDWLPGHDEKLWGALEMSDETEFYKIESDKRIWKTYGTQKSIFDPCPRGWRVPPGDLWLGLTSTGISVTASGNGGNLEKYWEMINCADADLGTTYNINGYTMYMERWKEGRTCFFPTQGSRLASGQPMHGGLCGNYHNATSDRNNRVNTLHFHKGPGAAQVNIFEPQLLYHVKAVAGPIRCVRDKKN